MKKLGLLVFIAAIVGSVALVWAVTGKAVSFVKINFSEQIKGSGNVATEKRDVRDFKGVDAGGAMRVEITVGKGFSVELEGDDNILPLVKTEVRGGVLHIERKEGSRTWTKSHLIARISMPELNELGISGASSALVTGVKSERLTINTSGASKVEISGEAREVKIDVSGASKLNGENLRTERADVEASGASKISIFASESINADASGASKVVYSGNPKSVSKDASGASSVSAN